MSTRKVPEHVVFTCDRCGAEGQRYETGPFRDGLHGRYETWAVGYDGAAGGAERQVDLCGDCAEAFSNWLKSLQHQPLSRRSS